MSALTVACGILIAAASAAPAAAGNADRAVAYGLLLDSPRPSRVVDEGILIADRLRRRYGIDTGDLLADRRAAAQRAREELLEKLTFTDDQIRASAAALGYSLDPKRCRNTCTHVRALALIELQKRALADFADGPEVPGAGPRHASPWGPGADACP